MRNKENSFPIRTLIWRPETLMKRHPMKGLKLQPGTSLIAHLDKNFHPEDFLSYMNRVRTEVGKKNSGTFPGQFLNFFHFSRTQFLPNNVQN